MPEIIDALNSLKSDLSEIKSAISQFNKPAVQSITEEWLDNQDVLMVLRISKRSLQHLRDSKILPYSRVKSKFYYKATDVRELLEKNYFRFNSGNQFKISKSLKS